MERLKPLNDYIFKRLFGEKGSEPILLAFLNAVLEKTQKETLVFNYIDTEQYHNCFHL